ncbi:MAG: SEC-C domain-containing protein, partial [Victivallales bacterium]|nr:SEC-C domain-containing protein [Victivallales bacterium]
IDEARTPLIIAGPAKESTHMYDKLKPSVAELYRRQMKLMSDWVQQAKDILDKPDHTEGEEDDAYMLLAKVQLGMPKHKQLMRLMEDASIRKALDKKDLEIHSDNNRGLLQKVKDTMYFAIDEKSHEADLSAMGREFLRPGDKDAFVIPDLPSIFSEIDADDELDEDAKIEKRRKAQEAFDEKSEIIQNISQLLRAYCLFEIDVHYVVQDNKVIIVDEFTGRPQPGRRFSEGLHQALEAKEGVQIERETQTLASITIQNYFRMYEKLAGMTGTAETEANEFKSIYNLDVVVVPTNRPCMRKDYNDRVYKTQREKYKAILEEITECNKRGQPVLVGTISVEVSELLSRMLQRQRIVHNVLNAKHHESEAEIVARAGQLGAVTIATNMAGRGTDIKLGPGVKEVGGLHVIGSERHDSRRIDRQLRGRCARQGDPGSSRFYISLEDNLMRLFGSDRISGIMEKLGLQEGEELEHPLLNRTIENAQRRVEQQHFAIRKRTLEYDDVVNKQRATIYELRKQILTTDNPKDLVLDYVYTAICDHAEAAYASRVKREPVDYSDVKDWLIRTFPIGFPADLFATQYANAEEFSKAIMARVEAAFGLKESQEGADAIAFVERYIMLNAIDDLYQDHLYTIDSLRQSVSLRSYGQRDPLVEFKAEAYKVFDGLMEQIKNTICQNVFRFTLQTQIAQQEAPRRVENTQEVHQNLDQFGGVGDSATPEAPAQASITVRRQTPKVGRNDPCPCGSGKKYKQCCGR